MRTWSTRLYPGCEEDTRRSGQPAEFSGGLIATLLRRAPLRTMAAFRHNHSFNKTTADIILLKRSLLAFLVMVILIFIGIFIFLEHDRSFHLTQIVTREGQAIHAVIDRIRRDLVRPVGDTLILANAPDTRAYLVDGEEHLRDHLAAEFSNLAINTQIYDQIRLIDDRGQEQIRIDYRDGRLHNISPEDLQDKSNRYYFEGTLNLESHEVFISPLDLNIEHSQVEVPYRPMIRFGVPIHDGEGRARGIILLNFQGQVILDHAVSAMTGAGDLMILNADGYWLLAPDPSDAWGFMLDHDRRFSDRHPEIWEAMSQAGSGSLANEEGLFVFESITPLDEATHYPRLDQGPLSEGIAGAGGNDRTWIILSHQNQGYLRDAGAMTLADAVMLGTMLAITAGMVQAGFVWLATRRRQAERETQLVHQRLVDAIETLPGAFAIFDGEDRLALCNSTYLETRGIGRQASEQGLTYEAILRAGLAEGRYPAAVGREDAWLLDCLAAHRNPGGQSEQLTNDGRWHLVRERRTRHGEIVDEHTDITKLKLREDQLIAANRQIERQAGALQEARNRAESARRLAEEASHAKSLFLASMSHELRTPLNSILGFSEIIHRELLGKVNILKYKEYAENIRSSGHHLLSLINQILDLSKIESGKMEIFPEELDVKHVIEQSIRMVDVEMRRRELTLETNTEQPSPILLADQEGVIRILQNLLSNALKFTPSGGRIDVDARRLDDGRTCIAVTDSGYGIPADQIQRLVQPFEQLDNQFGHANKGTGLGLAMVNSIMALHRGSMEIESAVGRGTTVRVIFPRVEPSSPR